jgi:ParB family chromosome partitioning protein
VSTARNTQPEGTLEYLDPNTVDIGKNVRDDADAGLVASIKELGILVPLTAVRSPEGTITIREGQRRTLAAREAGLATMPVFVRDDTATDDKTRTQNRVVEQITTNKERKPLKSSQEAKAIQELLDTGMTPTKVAKALTMPKRDVEAAAAAAGSAVALEALDTTQLTIEQAATLVEFENDPEAAAELMGARSAGDFDHRVSALRQKAATDAARAVAAISYRDKGHTILDQRPSWSDDLASNQLHQLCDLDGNRAEASHAIARPELFAVWLDEVEVYVDSRTGEIVDEQKIDWDVDAEDHDTAATEGYIHPRYIEDGTGFEPIYYCTDPNAAGLMTWAERARRKGGQAPHGEQDAAAREEAAKREKRKVVKLNKLGLAAEEVRRAWVKDKLLTRKTPPKGAALFIAGQLTAHQHLLTSNGTAQLTRELLGLAEHAPIHDSVTELPPTGDGRATVILLGLVLAALESNTPKDAWRTRGTYSKNYLTFLADNDYELSDVEKVVTGAMKADTLYDKIVSDTTTVDKVA